MKTNKKVILSSLVTGTTGVAVVTGTVLLNSISSKTSTFEGTEPSIGSSIITRSKLANTEHGKILKTSLEKLGTENECKNKGGEWSNSACSIPGEITKDVIVEEEMISGWINRDDCFSKGGYHENSTKSPSCKKPGKIFKPEFSKSINEWTKQENVKAPETTQNALSHIYNNSFLEIRKNDKEFAVVFSKEKLSSDFENWSFPKHFSHGGKSAAIEDICAWSYKTTNDSQGKNTFLYNEKTDSWWNCYSKKDVFLVRKDNESNSNQKQN